MKVSFTHLIAWAIVKAAQEWPVMARHFEESDGKPHVVEAGSINLGIAVDVERKGQRSLMVPCIKGADALDFRGFHAYYEELITKTRENKLTADDFQGTNISLTNPGGLGTIASVPRLMSGQGTIIACGSLAYPVEWAHAPADKVKALGVSKVMTTTSTYDHRVIQGAESGSFLRRIEELLQGEDEFYESVARDLEVDEAVVTKAHAAAASAAPLAAPPRRRRAAAKPDAELLQAVQAAHLAAEGLPHPRPPGGEPRSPRLRAQGRPRDPAREPEPDAGADGPDPGRDPADRRRGRDPARGPPAHARGLLRHDGLPGRAPLQPPAARLAARDDRDRLASQAAGARGEARAARPADRRVRLRALRREGLPGPEDVLDRGPGHRGADARRAVRDGPHRGRPGGRDRDGPPRPAQRPRPQPRPPAGLAAGRVRGRQGDRGGQGRRRDPHRRHRRRQVPLRPPGDVHHPRRRRDRGPPLPEPEPPRVRGPRRHRRSPGRPDQAHRTR